MKTTLITLLLIISSVYAAPIHKGNFYIQTFCDRFEGKKNYNLDSGTQVDCYTGSHVIEIDKAYNWASAFGKALYASLVSNKKGGVVLIMEHPTRDKTYLNKLRKVAKKNRIYIWIMHTNGTIQGIH